MFFFSVIGAIQMLYDDDDDDDDDDKNTSRINTTQCNTDLLSK